MILGWFWQGTLARNQSISDRRDIANCEEAKIFLPLLKPCAMKAWVRGRVK